MTLLIVIFILLVAASAFFSSSETAFFSLDPPQLHANENSKRMPAIKGLLKKPERLLITFLVSNIFVNITATSILENIIARIFPSKYVELSTVFLMTIIILIFGEVLPKTYALRNAFFLASIFSPIIWIIKIPFTPLIFLLKKINTILMKFSELFLRAPPVYVTGKELNSLLENERRLPQKKKEWIKRIIRLKDYSAKDIMTPRSMVLTADIEEGFKSICAISVQNHFYRLPIWKDKPDNIIGIFNAFKWFEFKNTDKENQTLFINDPIHISTLKAVTELFPFFEKDANAILIVINEHSEFMGIITLDDIMGCIIREMEASRPGGAPFIHRIKSHTYYIDAMMKKEDFESTLNLDFSKYSASTVNGLILDYLGRIPETGELIELNNLSFTILERTEKMIKKLLVVRSQKS